MNSVFLKDLSIHEDWHPFLSKEILAIIRKIEKDVSTDGYTPSSNRVLRFFEFPLSSAKIIILGQDPYPQPGVATGRAFEVGNLINWDQTFRNISLKNILRGIYKAYTGETIKYNDLKGKLVSEFPILPPCRLFKYWESIGILLLNTSFTCKPGNPGSHKKEWNGFTYSLLEYINYKASNATWFLWGNHAREATGHIEVTNSIITMHPMMCYDQPGRNTDFLYGKQNCFEPFIGQIDWTGFGNRFGSNN